MGLNLKEPIGPLPLGAWVAVVAGGLGISWYSRRHSSAPAAVTAAAPVTDGAGTFGPGGVGDVTTGGSDGASGPVAPAPQTNEEWARLAELTLLGHGFDPLTVDRAVGDYIGGRNLDAGEKGAIDAALRFIGPPPIPVPPPVPPSPGDGTSPPPVIITPPTPPPLSGHILQFFGSGYGPVGAQPGPGESPLSGSALFNAESVEKGLDGHYYEWLPNPEAAKVAQAAGQTAYLEIAPGVFVPQLTPVPDRSAAQYIRVG